MIAFSSGILSGLALIIAIGAQNAFVIRQGLQRQHVLTVVLFCAISDALLIAAGTAGLGKAIESAPEVLEIVRWFGVTYLIFFGLKSLRSTLLPTITLFMRCRLKIEEVKKMTTWKIFGETMLELDNEIICVDADLDKEIVIVDGQRLTEARAEQISEEIMEVVYKHKGMKFVPRKLQN